MSVWNLFPTMRAYTLPHLEGRYHTWKGVGSPPGITVCVYVDAERGEPHSVKARLPRATVYRSARLPDGSVIVSHTKFIIVDHEVVLLTSANFTTARRTAGSSAPLCFCAAE